MLAASWWQDCGQLCTLYTHVYNRFISWWPPWGLAKWVSNDIPLVVVGYNLRLMLPLHGYCVTNHVTQFSASYSIISESPLALKNESYKSIPHSPQKLIPKSHTTLSRNGSQNLIPHSPEVDIKKTYFPLSHHESTLHNIHIQHFFIVG